MVPSGSVKFADQPTWGTSDSASCSFPPAGRTCTRVSSISLTLNHREGESTTLWQTALPGAIHGDKIAIIGMMHRVGYHSSKPNAILETWIVRASSDRLWRVCVGAASWSAGRGNATFNPIGSARRPCRVLGTAICRQEVSTKGSKIRLGYK